MNQRVPEMPHLSGLIERAERLIAKGVFDSDDAAMASLYVRFIESAVGGLDPTAAEWALLLERLCDHATDGAE
jgi:hypothetical protein